MLIKKTVALCYVSKNKVPFDEKGVSHTSVYELAALRQLNTTVDMKPSTKYRDYHGFATSLTLVVEGKDAPVELHLPGGLGKPGDPDDGTHGPVLGRLLGRAPGRGDGDDGRGLDVVGGLDGGDGSGGGAVHLVALEELVLMGKQ